MSKISVTCTAPVNIAVLKYWGKRDERLLLPLHTSISATLDQADLKTTTSATASASFEEDELWLNGNKEDINNKRIQNVLTEIRKRIKEVTTKDENGADKVISRDELLTYKVHVHSHNNFPTASGLASSASGYACLGNVAAFLRANVTVFTLATLFQIQEAFPGELTAIARVGSGSACRSLYGGWVQWISGEKETGEDSIAVQLADHEHWPLDIYIVVVNKGKKEVSSTSGMQTSVETSDLLKIRTSDVVPKRAEVFKKAIAEKDFQTFAEHTMKDSNSFHSVCSDTFPPIFYMNETSKRIIHLIHAYNNYHGQFKAAYTFDAGPNCVIFVEPGQNSAEVRELLNYYFPTADSAESKLDEKQRNFMEPVAKGLIERIITTRVGPGPHIVQ